MNCKLKSKRQEVLYVNPYDLSKFNLSAKFFSILFRHKPTKRLNHPVILEWEELEIEK